MHPWLGATFYSRDSSFFPTPFLLATRVYCLSKVLLVLCTLDAVQRAPRDSINPVLGRRWRLFLDGLFQSGSKLHLTLLQRAVSNHHTAYSLRSLLIGQYIP